jgi:hypothetical protein
LSGLELIKLLHGFLRERRGVGGVKRQDILA